MAQRDPIQTFGLCKAVFYDVNTKDLIGPPIKILQNFSIKSETEQIDNFGGCSAFPWATANGKASAEGQLTFNEISPWMYKVFAGANVSYIGEASKGTVGDLVNTVGTSITNDSTGIKIQALASSESKIKFGVYSVKALTSTTIKVKANYSELNNDMTLAEGTIEEVNTAIADYGLEVVENGSTALVEGDMAYFETAPVNKGAFKVEVGTGANIPYVGMRIYRPMQDGYLEEIDVHKVKFNGLPETMTANEFVNIEASFKPIATNINGKMLVYTKRVISINNEIENA